MAVFVHANLVDPVVHFQTVGAERHRQRGVQRVRPLGKRFLVVDEQRVHGFHQRLAHALAKGAYRQHPLALDTLERGEHGVFARFTAIHRLALGGNQLILQLPVLQAVQGKRLDIQLGERLLLEVDAQARVEERLGGFAQETAQLGKRERDLLLEGGQGGGRLRRLRRWRVQRVPLVGVGE